MSQDPFCIPIHPHPSPSSETKPNHPTKSFKKELICLVPTTLVPTRVPPSSPSSPSTIHETIPWNLFFWIQKSSSLCAEPIHKLKEFDLTSDGRPLGPKNQETLEVQRKASNIVAWNMPIFTRKDIFKYIHTSYGPIYTFKHDMILLPACDVSLPECGYLTIPSIPSIVLPINPSINGLACYTSPGCQWQLKVTGELPIDGLHHPRF